MKRKESHSIEFKQSWRSEYLKVISAFANSEGGSLYIGLDDDGNPVPLKNVKNGVMSVIFYKDRWNEENLRKLKLNDRQIKAVLYVKREGEITNQKYQTLCKTSNRTATRDLTELTSLKIFQQIGTTGKGTKYVLRSHTDAKDAT